MQLSFRASTFIIPEHRRPGLLRPPLLLIPAMLATAAFGQTLTTLHDFGSVLADGLAPGPGVVIDQNGNVFGTTGIGGSKISDGTVWELSPPATAGTPWTETILHRFQGSPDGQNAESRLTMAPDGTLFGTTTRGGTNNMGLAYQITLQSDGSGKGKVIHNFGATPDDVISPNLGFLLEPGGLLAVDQGGVNSTGAVYLLTPTGQGGLWKQTILFNFGQFQSGDAASPGGELVEDSSGNFYGVTAQGGAHNLGAIYKLSPPSVQGNPWTESVIFSFDGTNGTLPAGRLLLGGHGQLFGTTNGGGDSGSGTVFELVPPSVAGQSWTYTILHSFTGGTDGGFPENGVIKDAFGRLYGSASNTIFMLTAPPTSGGTWKETVLHTFSGPDGFVASTALTLFRNALYGTTSEGGGFGRGTAFQLTLP